MRPKLLFIAAFCAYVRWLTNGEAVHRFPECGDERPWQVCQLRLEGEQLQPV